MARLTILLPTLGIGGAEKSYLQLAPALIAAGWQVTFVLYRAEGALLSTVPAGVRIVSLEADSTKAALLPLIRFLRREKPAVLISNLVHTNLMTIVAVLLARVPTRIVVTFHNTLSQECKVRRGGTLLMLACRLLLRFADTVLAVSKGVGQDLIRHTKVNPNKVHVIYNPVVDDNFFARSQQPISHPWFDGNIPVILGVGRLVEQKDFAMLIRAFSILEKNIPCRLVIIGDGKLESYFNILLDKLNLKDKAILIGHIANPLPYMRAASMCVLSSRYEGLGNVLIESLACGTPVVSTDCPYGPAEILENGKWGRLVPVGDAESMAKAIEATLRNPQDKAALQKRGQEFSVQSAVQHYCQLLEKL